MTVHEDGRTTRRGFCSAAAFPPRPPRTRFSQALAAQLGNRHSAPRRNQRQRQPRRQGRLQGRLDSTNGSLEVLDVECNSPQFMALVKGREFLFYTLNSGFMTPEQKAAADAAAKAAAAAPPPAPGAPGARGRRGGGGAKGEGGAVSACTFNNKTGAMSLINEVSCASQVPAPIFGVDHTNSSATSPTTAGAASAPSSNQRRFPARPALQVPAAADSTTSRPPAPPSGTAGLVNDLGLAASIACKMDPKTAKLTPADPPQWDAAPGSGCRGLQLSPCRADRLRCR